MIIIPIKWLFHWEYTLFSDKPKLCHFSSLSMCFWGGKPPQPGHVMATAAQVTPSMSDVVGRERLGWPTTGLNKTNDSENQFPNYICIYIYTYTHIYIYTYTYIYIYIHMYIHIHNIYIYIYIYTYIYIYIYTYMYYMYCIIYIYLY